MSVRDKHVLIRVSEDEKKSIEVAAQNDGKSVSAFLRDLAVQRLIRIKAARKRKGKAEL